MFDDNPTPAGEPGETPERRAVRIAAYLGERVDELHSLIAEGEPLTVKPADDARPATSDGELIETIAAWLYEEFSDYDDWGHAPQRKREYYLDRARELAAALSDRAQPAPEVAAAADHIIRDILESLCRRDGLSLESAVVPGEPARNYELALRLGIGHVFGLEDEKPQPAPAGGIVIDIAQPPGVTVNGIPLEELGAPEPKPAPELAAAMTVLAAEMRNRANAPIPPDAVDFADRIVRAQVLYEYADRIRQALERAGIPS